MQTDLFPFLNRRLTDEEAREGFAKLKAAVAAMTFQTDQAMSAHTASTITRRRKPAVQPPTEREFLKEFDAWCQRRGQKRNVGWFQKSRTNQTNTTK